MTYRFRAQVRRPLRLEAFSVLARTLRHAAYNSDAPATQPIMWSLHHDLQTIAKAERPEWIYNDRLHVALADRAAMVVVDMRNSQFIGADITLPAFSLGYEPDIGLALDACAPDDGVVLDVGANWGYFPVFLSARPGFRGRVLAIEPFPPSFQSLQGVVSGLGLAALVEPIPLAAGRETKRVAMSDEVFSGNNRIVEGAGVEVGVTTIDAIVAERGLSRVDFIKIDVEGAEPDAVAGARETIARFAPPVMFEDWFAGGSARVSATFEEIVAIADYEFFVLDVEKPSRFQAPDVGADRATSLAVVATLSPFAPANRDLWPDRVNVLALPRGYDWAARFRSKD